MLVHTLFKINKQKHKTSAKLLSKKKKPWFFSLQCVCTSIFGFPLFMHTIFINTKTQQQKTYSKQKTPKSRHITLHSSFCRSFSCLVKHFYLQQTMINKLKLTKYKLLICVLALPTTQQKNKNATCRYN